MEKCCEEDAIYDPLSLTFMLKLPIAERVPGGPAAWSDAADEALCGGSETRSCVSVEGMKMDYFQDVIPETTAEHLHGAEKFWTSETLLTEEQQLPEQEGPFLYSLLSCFTVFDHLWRSSKSVWAEAQK